MQNLIDLPEEFNFNDILAVLRDTPEVQNLKQRGVVVTWTLEGLNFVMSKDKDGYAFISTRTDRFEDFEVLCKLMGV